MHKLHGADKIFWEPNKNNGDIAGLHLHYHPAVDPVANNHSPSLAHFKKATSLSLSTAAIVHSTDHSLSSTGG